MSAGPDRLRSAVCEVWWATPSDRAALGGLIDDAEHRRAALLRHRGDRNRFVTARALLRLLLAERTGTPPTDLRLDTTCYRCGAEHGKPRLVGHGETTSFSIAHSADRVVVALTDGAAVGVDVEGVGDRTVEELNRLSDSILAPVELVDYRRVEPARRAWALAVWWTRKEAVLKATGDGLTVPMPAVAVTAPDEPPALHGGGRRRGLAAMVALHDLRPGRGSVACVAALGTELTVTERDADELLASAGKAGRARTTGRS